MMNRLTHHWNFPRIIRLILGIVVVAQAVTLQEYVLAAFGGLVALLALLNVNTCMASGCSSGPRMPSQNHSTAKRIDYEKLDHSA